MLGVAEVAQSPSILLALNPVYAFEFFKANHLHGIVVLGSVVLCITGGEALYADLGHFGRNAIRTTWLGVACPALLLNYFGQCALLLDHPDAGFHPFYGLVPEILLYPMVALSTIATVIASQALISGAFSLTQQAIHLGFSPRVHIVHTSAEIKGQIYIPGVNYAPHDRLPAPGALVQGKQRAGGGLRVGSDRHHEPHLAAVPGSGRLRLALAADEGAAPGPAVPRVRHQLLRCQPPEALRRRLDHPAGRTRDHGSSLPPGAAAARKSASNSPRDCCRWMRFLADLERHPITRVRGTAVFMTLSTTGTPPTLLHHVKHNHVLHDHVVLLTIQAADTPVGA